MGDVVVVVVVVTAAVGGGSVVASAVAGDVLAGVAEAAGGESVCAVAMPVPVTPQPKTKVTLKA